MTIHSGAYTATIETMAMLGASAVCSHTASAFVQGMGSRGKAQGPLIPPSLGQHAESQLPGLVLERDRDVERGEQVVEEPFVVLLATGGPVLASRLAPPAARVGHPVAISKKSH